MESRSLEIKVLHGKDLKAFNFFQKLTLFVVVSIDGKKKLKHDQKHRTPTDKDGDGKPEWNHEMRFDLKEIPLEDCDDDIFVHFELKHGGVTMFGDKTIGHVRVPIKDLISEFNGVVRFVDYEVRGNDGKPNGVLTFSYKVNGLNSSLGTNYPGTKVTGFPIAYDSQQQPAPELQYPPAPYPAYSSPPGSLYPPPAQYPSYSSPPGSLYPPPEPETYSTQQQDIQQYASSGTGTGRPHEQQESYYPPPPNTYHHHPPPSAPAYYPHQPPPQSPTAHGAFYPPPPGNPAHGAFYPWAAAAAGSQMNYHSYSLPPPGTRIHSDGHVNSFGHGETAPSGYSYGNYRHSSSWQGR